MGSEWKPVSLGDVIEINPRRNYERGKMAPYVPMNALTEWKRKIARLDRRENTGSGSKFINGDVLLARITPCLENGKTAYVDVLEEGEVGFGSTEFIVLRGKEGIIDNLFVYYFSRSEEFRSFAIKSMSGTSGRQRVPNAAISEYQFMLPPLAEQKRIAHILGTLDDKIELNQRMNETLEAMARAIFKAWFVDFEPVKAKLKGEAYPLPDEIMALFPDELVESELGLIPQGWRVGKLGNYISFIKGRKPRATSEHKIKGYLPQILIKTFDSGDYLFADPVNKVIANEDDILMVMDGASSGRLEIGYTGVVGSTLAVVKTIENINFFVYQFLKLKSKDIKDNTTGTSIPHADKAKILNYNLVVPDEQLILKYDDWYFPIFETKRTNDKQSATLAKTRDSLLPKLLSGEIDI